MIEVSNFDIDGSNQLEKLVAARSAYLWLPFLTFAYLGLLWLTLCYYALLGLLRLTGPYWS